jgi:hypothetical protein
LDVETEDDKFGVAQIIENINCADLQGQTVTLSFQAKVSATTKLDNVKCAIVAWSGTADSVTSDIISAWGAEGTNPTLIANATYENTPANLNVTTDWATYTVSAPIDTASTNNVIVFIWSDVTDTTAGDFLYLAGVQLEAGSVATPFERRPIGTELMLCQRYLPALRTTSEEALGGGYCPNTTLIDVLFSFQVPARVPTTGITTSAANTFLQQNGANAITGVSFLVGGATATYVRFTTSGVTALQANGVRSTGASTFILFTGCEL